MTDIDGVLNLFPNPSRTGEFDKQCCINLEMLLNKAPDLKIVISSSWRAFGLQAVRDILKSNGIDPRRVIDVLGDEQSVDPNDHRGYQVQCWLDRNPKVKIFAIVDDYADFGSLNDKLVQTNRYNGLTQSIAEELMAVLRIK
jgi:hypothetical protein